MAPLAILHIFVGNWTGFVRNFMAKSQRILNPGISIPNLVDTAHPHEMHKGQAEEQVNNCVR